MKHLIVTHPRVEKKLSTIQLEPELLEELNHQLNCQFEGLSIVRVESDPGNGSSHLLHAIANQLRQNGSSTAFFQFKEGDSFINLTSYHLNNLHNAPFVFMDNVHHILSSPSERNEILKFLQLVADNNGTLIYSCETEELLDNRLQIEKPFSGPSLAFYLKALKREDKLKWAKKLLDEKTVEELDQAFFDDSITNATFLKSLAPYIEQQATEFGNNYAFLRQQEEALYQLEIRMLRTQLAILELETKKTEIIRDQQYEKVADIRQEQRALADELEAIENELAALSIQPKPSQKAMNLYIHSLKIENCLNANKTAFLSAIDTIKGKLEEINEQKKELTLESEKSLRRRVFQDSVNWTNVLERYTIN
jgi:hypothetical protein